MIRRDHHRETRTIPDSELGIAVMLLLLLVVLTVVIVPGLG